MLYKFACTRNLFKYLRFGGNGGHVNFVIVPSKSPNFHSSTVVWSGFPPALCWSLSAGCQRVVFLWSSGISTDIVCVHSRQRCVYTVSREEAKCLWTPYTHPFFRGLISYCWYNPQPMRNDHSIAGTTILQTTLEDADNTQFLLMVRQIRW